MTYNLTFNGIPIVFDEHISQDTFYIVSNNFDAKRQQILNRILAGVEETLLKAQISGKT